MDPVDDGFDLVEHLRVLIDPFLPDDADEGDESGDEEPDLVIPAVLIEFVDALDIPRLGFPLDHVRAFHGQHHHAVFDLYVAHLPRRKQRLILRIHTSLPRYSRYLILTKNSVNI